MKRLLIAFALILAAGVAHAAGNVTESPIGFVGGKFDTTISTTAWTKVYLATAVVEGTPQNGIVVNNPSTNSASMGCTFADSAPSVSTATANIELKNTGDRFFPISGGMFLYCVSKNTQPERVTSQFVRQQP